jgi:glycosyltransferase involved in cell wall biosynthesis
MTVAPRPLRVLHVQQASGIGGSERHLAMLLPALAEAGVEVRMLVAVAGDGDRFADDLRSRGVEVDTVPAGPDLNPLLVRRIGRAISAWEPDLVHTHLVHADLHGQPAARNHGVPAVSSVHDTLAALSRRPLRTLAARTGRLPRVTIAISREVRRYVESVGIRPPGSVRVVHYGIDAGAWAADDEQRESSRADLGMEPGEVVVAATSRLIPGKGHADLIEGFALAHARAPQLRLVIAGSGPLREELEHLAAGNENVTFLGFQDDVRPLVQAADVMAFPTLPALGEGFGLTALEAMAAGRPVVATSVGAIPEVVEHEETGLLVAPHDSAALADALVRLAEAPTERSAMGRAGAERAAEAFSLTSLLHGTLAVYSEALGRPVVGPASHSDLEVTEAAGVG